MAKDYTQMTEEEVVRELQMQALASGVPAPGGDWTKIAIDLHHVAMLRAGKDLFVDEDGNMEYRDVKQK